MRSVQALVVALLLLVGNVRQALACACCANPGYRREETSQLTAYERAELQRVGFSSRVRVYQTESDEPIPGIAGPTRDFTLSSSLSGATLTWKLTGAPGKGQGTITLTLPAKVERFYVDTHDGPADQDPVLYKEWRFSTKISASGDFKPGMAKGTTAKLILHGRGNVCDDATMFSHWTLVVKGPKADYTLFGALAKPRHG
jgi:hypothetical protein